MNANERADAIIKDILDNHLPRVIQGLKAGYVDENQVLVIYDHAVRARILKEFAEAQPALEELDNLGKLNRELEAEWRAEQIEQTQGKTVGDIPPFVHPGEKAQDEAALHGLVNVPTPGIPCGVLTQRENVRAIVVGTDGMYVQYVQSAKEDGASIEYALTHVKDEAFVCHLPFAERIAQALSAATDARKKSHLVFRAEVTKRPVTPAVPAVPRKLKDEIESGLAYIQGRSTLDGGHQCYVQELGETPGSAKIATEKGQAKLLPIEVAKKHAQELTRAYADMEFEVKVVADQGWEPTKDTLQCACGGLVKEFPTSVEPMLKCERCGRVYLDEDEVFKTRQTESIKPAKCADATYWTTGTLAGGTDPVPMQTEINLNGRKVTINAVNGKFVLTYEQIVRMAVNQRRGPLNAFTGTDAELPHETVVYHHRCDFKLLPGERDGSLWKGKSVECTPGMVIDCVNTGNA